MKKKVSIIGTNGLPASYGGFETLTHYLTQYLSDSYDFVVYCSATPKDKQLESYNNAKLKYIPFKANGYQSVIYDCISIIHSLISSDILLILGQSGALALPLKKFVKKKKIVLNIGGIEWGRSKWNALIRKYIELSELICTKYADIIITDNRFTQKLCMEKYNISNCVLIEYGGDHAKNEVITKEAKNKYSFLNSEYYLSISRAQSDNNLHMLLNAFEQMTSKSLVIVSNWETSDYGKKLKEKYCNKFNNIHLLDAIYDQKELDMIRSNAYVYIHSHSFCGTAPSLVEAMNLGLPVICFDVQTNIETTENKSLYFNSEQELMSIITSLNQQTIHELKNKLTNIAKRRYVWDIISKKYADCF